MRLFFATILMAFLASNAANASSFVVVDERDGSSSPSILVMGGAAPASASAPLAGNSVSAHASPSIERFGEPPANFVSVSASVIAMINAPQPVAFENVASIGDEDSKRHPRNSMPMVIRGGIVGDSFGSASTPAASSAPSPQPRQEVSAPESSSGGGGGSEDAPPDPEPQRVPKSALPPAAAPTGRME